MRTVKNWHQRIGFWFFNEACIAWDRFLDYGREGYLWQSKMAYLAAILIGPRRERMLSLVNFAALFCHGRLRRKILVAILESQPDHASAWINLGVDRQLPIEDRRRYLEIVLSCHNSGLFHSPTVLESLHQKAKFKLVQLEESCSK